MCVWAGEMCCHFQAQPYRDASYEINETYFVKIFCAETSGDV